MSDPRKVEELEEELSLRDGEIDRLTKLYAATKDALEAIVHQVQIAKSAFVECKTNMTGYRIQAEEFLKRAGKAQAALAVANARIKVLEQLEANTE